MKLSVAVVLAGLFLLSVPLLAHHSAGNFWYVDRNVEIKGVVKSVKIVNPHPELAIEVTEGNGQKSLWRISYGGNASAWVRRGWKTSSLPIGTVVTITGHPSRTEGAKALLLENGKIVKADGTVMDFDEVPKTQQQ
jgi:hypothetical protein